MFKKMIVLTSEKNYKTSIKTIENPINSVETLILMETMINMNDYYLDKAMINGPIAHLISSPMSKIDIDKNATCYLVIYKTGTYFGDIETSYISFIDNINRIFAVSHGGNDRADVGFHEGAFGEFTGTTCCNVQHLDDGTYLFGDG